MKGNFYKRLNEYFIDCATELKAKSGQSSIFANTSDIGQSRENSYVEFIERHTPSAAKINLGGFLFNEDGEESGQIDVIVTSNISPRFQIYRDNPTKIFTPVQGTLAVASVKSNLDKRELINSLENIASIPEKKTQRPPKNPALDLIDYEDWPLKIIFAYDGIDLKLTMDHIRDFYRENNISNYRRPNIIHVLGKYLIFRVCDYYKNSLFSAESGEKLTLPPGDFYCFLKNIDPSGLLYVVNSIQHKSNTIPHIMLNYDHITNKINNI